MLRQSGPPRPSSVYLCGMLMRFDDRRDQHPRVLQSSCLYVFPGGLYQRFGPLGCLLLQLGSLEPPLSSTLSSIELPKAPST
ncbi:unnamed protein product [Cochlearia groenlandica]